MASSLGTVVAVAALLGGMSGCTCGPPTFELDASSPSGDTGTAAKAFPSAAGVSIHVGFASTPPPGDYRFVRLHDSGRAEIREVLSVDGPGPWLTYEGEVTIPPATARAIVQAADPVRLSTAPAPEPGAPCVLGLASSTALVWRGCADAALARRVLADVPALTPAAVGARCSKSPCEVRLVRGVPARHHERYGRISQDIVIDAAGGFSCATASAGGGEARNRLRVVRGRIRAADAGAVFDWLAAAIPRSAGPRAPGDGIGATGVVARGPGGVWTTVAKVPADATWARWARLTTRLPAACRRPPDGLTWRADAGH